jgi:hypothetical protein
MACHDLGPQPVSFFEPIVKSVKRKKNTDPTSEKTAFVLGIVAIFMGIVALTLGWLSFTLSVLMLIMAGLGICVGVAGVGIVWSEYKEVHAVPAAGTSVNVLAFTFIIVAMIFSSLKRQVGVSEHSNSFGIAQIQCQVAPLEDRYPSRVSSGCYGIEFKCR